jgi:hypothetical protein
MGLGPNNQSLLTKLGKKQAWEMTPNELETIIAADQARRTVQRAMGRVLRQSREDGTKAKANRAPLTLERLGFAPAICSQLRLTGKSEAELIKLMRAKGLL